MSKTKIQQKAFPNIFRYWNNVIQKKNFLRLKKVLYKTLIVWLKPNVENDFYFGHFNAENSGIQSSLSLGQIRVPWKPET